jgi:hypothetical protein
LPAAAAKPCGCFGAHRFCVRVTDFKANIIGTSPRWVEVFIDAAGSPDSAAASRQGRRGAMRGKSRNRVNRALNALR